MNANEQLQSLLAALGKRKDAGFWLLKYGVVFLVFLFVFLPVRGRLASHLSETNSLKRQITDLKNITSSMLTPEEIERVRGRVDRFESKLADESKASTILDQVSQLAEENHLKLIQIYLDSPVTVKDESGRELEVSGKKLNLLPVSFRVEADYKNFANFLKALNDQAQWIYTVESLQMQRASEESEFLQCDVTLSFIAQ